MRRSDSGKFGNLQVLSETIAHFENRPLPALEQIAAISTEEYSTMDKSSRPDKKRSRDMASASAAPASASASASASAASARNPTVALSSDVKDMLKDLKGQVNQQVLNKLAKAFLVQYNAYFVVDV
jgi:hypothetical protein